MVGTSTGPSAAAGSRSPGNTAAGPTGSLSSSTSAMTPSTIPVTPKAVPVPGLSTASVDSSIAVYADCTRPVAEQKPTVEPSEIVMACADNGFGIGNVKWASWTAGSATGSGTTYYKDCRPDCADGKIVETPGVHITLAHPVRGASGGLVWSQITFSTLPPGYPERPQPLPTRPI